VLKFNFGGDHGADLVLILSDGRFGFILARKLS